MFLSDYVILSCYLKTYYDTKEKTFFIVVCVFVPVCCNAINSFHVENLWVKVVYSV
jgi:hypothetical protein